MAKRKRGTGRVIRKGDSPNWYVAFKYFGIPIVRTTGEEATEANKLIWEDWLDNMPDEIRKRRFRFADVFKDASDEEKKRFTALEDQAYKIDKTKLDVNEVTFGDIAKGWTEKKLSDPTRRDKEEVRQVEMHVLPVFEKMTLNMIKRDFVEDFLANLVHIDRRHVSRLGKPLATDTKKHIMTNVHSIWNLGCYKNEWELPDPFKNISPKALVERPKPVHFTVLQDPEFIENNRDWANVELDIPYCRRVLMFAEWNKLSANLGWTKPIIHFFMLTGTIYSEVAALQWRMIDDHVIRIHQSFDCKTNTVDPTLKTPSRHREIVITDEIRNILREIKGDKKVNELSYVFTSPDDPILHYNRLNARWNTAVKRAKLGPLAMYCTRHTFIGWALTMGVPIIQVAAWAGHADRKMIDVRYGKYRTKIEEDMKEITRFFGRGFYEPMRIPGQVGQFLQPSPQMPLT